MNPHFLQMHRKRDCTRKDRQMPSPDGLSYGPEITGPTHHSDDFRHGKIYRGTKIVMAANKY